MNRRKAIAAAFSSVAVATAASVGDAAGQVEHVEHVILTPKTHSPCRLVDANGAEISVRHCVWANATTGETRHLSPSDDGYCKSHVVDGRPEPVIETRWHPAPLRWYPA